MVIHKKVKPLSVNQCWIGRRFKTPAYKAYEKYLMMTLPKMVVPVAPYSVYFEWGFSSASSDYDNPIKPTQDILQKKYGFNDKEIVMALIRKKKVAKGDEYFIFEIDHYDEDSGM